MVPLGWDKQHDIIRFCGEREIDPEMKAEILKGKLFLFDN